MNGFADRQRGLSAIGLLVVLVVGMSLVVMGIRLVPVYLESLEVGSIVDSVAEDPAMRGASRSDIRRALDRRFSVNTIRGVSREDVTISETATGIEIVVDYEVRVPLIANLDAVASFRKSAVVPQ